MGDNDESTIDVPVQDELTKLKAQADLLGIKYHPSIGVDSLRIKVNNKLSDSPVPDEELEDEEEDSAEPTAAELEEEAPVVSSIPKPTEQAAAVVAPVAPAPAPVAKAKEVPVVSAPERVMTAQEKVNAARDAARKEATRLVRINVQCMNPLKKEWPGEIFTVGNGLIGTVSKFVPFDTVDGWHVPNIIYLMMKERQFQQFSAKKVPKGQPSSRVTKLVREFNIEVMDPLTETELAQLKQRQLIAKNSQE